MGCFVVPHTFPLERNHGVERIILKKDFLPDRDEPSRREKRDCYRLRATNLAQLSADAFHLVSKGALLAAQLLGDAAVGDFVVSFPELDDAVCIRVKLTKPLEQQLQKSAVSKSLLQTDGFGLLGVQKVVAIVGV